MDGFSLFLCKGRFSLYKFVAYCVASCLQQAYDTSLKSLIYPLQCRRVVCLPLVRCMRESCAVSIDLDRTRLLILGEYSQMKVTEMLVLGRKANSFTHKDIA